MSFRKLSKSSLVKLATDLTEENNELLTDLASNQKASDKEIDELHQQIKKISKKHDKLLNDKQVLEGFVAIQSEKIQQYRLLHDETVVTVEGLKNIVSDIRAKDQEKTDKIISLGLERDELKKQIESYQDGSLLSVNIKTSATDYEMKAVIEKSKTPIEFGVENEEILIGEIENMSELVSRLRSDVEKLSKKKSSAESIIKKQVKEIEELKSFESKSYSKLYANHIKAKTEIEELKKQVESLKKQIK